MPLRRLLLRPSVRLRPAERRWVFFEQVKSNYSDREKDREEGREEGKEVRVISIFVSPQGASSKIRFLCSFLIDVLL